MNEGTWKSPLQSEALCTLRNYLLVNLQWLLVQSVLIAAKAQREELPGTRSLSVNTID